MLITQSEMHIFFLPVVAVVPLWIFWLVCRIAEKRAARNVTVYQTFSIWKPWRLPVSPLLTFPTLVVPPILAGGLLLIGLALTSPHQRHLLGFYTCFFVGILVAFGSVYGMFARKTRVGITPEGIALLGPTLLHQQNLWMVNPGYSLVKWEEIVGAKRMGNVWQIETRVVWPGWQNVTAPLLLPDHPVLATELARHGGLP